MELLLKQSLRLAHSPLCHMVIPCFGNLTPVLKNCLVGLRCSPLVTSCGRFYTLVLDVASTTAPPNPRTASCFRKHQLKDFVIDGPKEVKGPRQNRNDEPP